MCVIMLCMCQEDIEEYASKLQEILEVMLPAFNSQNNICLFFPYGGFCHMCIYSRLDDILFHLSLSKSTFLLLSTDF